MCKYESQGIIKTIYLVLFCHYFLAKKKDCIFGRVHLGITENNSNFWVTSSSGANRKTTQQATMSAVWSFLVLYLVGPVYNGCKHELSAKPECIGEYLQFYNAVHLIDAVIIFFKGLALLCRHGIIQPVAISPMNFSNSLTARLFSVHCSWGFIFPDQNSSSLFPISDLLPRYSKTPVSLRSFPGIRALFSSDAIWLVWLCWHISASPCNMTLCHRKHK